MRYYEFLLIMRAVLLVFVSLVVWASQEPIYYVDAVNGNDANPGTLAAPRRTIQKAAATIEGGSVVNVAAGTYNERVVVTRSGSPGALMTFQAQGNVVMQGFTIYADYVRVVGFEITNSLTTYADGNGVGVQGRFNQVLDNYIHDILFGQGIWLYGGPNRDASFTSDNIVA